MVSNPTQGTQSYRGVEAFFIAFDNCYATQNADASYILWTPAEPKNAPKFYTKPTPRSLKRRR